MVLVDTSVWIEVFINPRSSIWSRQSISARWSRACRSFTRFYRDSTTNTHSPWPGKPCWRYQPWSRPCDERSSSRQRISTGEHDEADGRFAPAWIV